QRLYVLDLSSRRIPVQISGAVSKQATRCDADPMAIAKVGGTAAAIRPAAHRFLHHQGRIEEFTGEGLAGTLRAVVGGLTAEEAIAEAQRNLALKKASVQAEIDAANARSAAAGPLAQAERDQAILTEQQKVAERNAELKQRQLDTEVRKPADAARYRIEQEA